ncbi:hypothetical protein DH2020_029866 [Rehmannia glutinosa]|uniref:Uncharacterized protein n=1 Tax=Rehmannia glutinosa TaxID=99300 RepID=A0ABR0VQ98_REHGL
MLRDYCCCCYGVGSSDSADVADRDPVVLVSGIGGSILNSKRKKFGFETRVWVRILLADLEFKKKLWSIYNPETGYTEPLDDSTEIIVPQDDYGLYAIDILDPSIVVKCLHLTDVYHFHDMIDMLVGCGYKKGTTLFGYGYDFRQSNREAGAAYKASGGRKVNIISHSMGGLLVSCFISLHDDTIEMALMPSMWPACYRFLSVSSILAWACCCKLPRNGWPFPWLHAVVALVLQDASMTLYLLGCSLLKVLKASFFVSRWSMHQLLVECPSVYEMLPNPDFDWKKQPEIKVWRKHSNDGETLVGLESYGRNDCVTLFEEALKNNELNYDGKTVALPFNHAILKWAAGTELRNKTQLPKGFLSTTFMEHLSTRLLMFGSYGSESSPIDELSEICHTMPEYSYVDGDGTVPSESAKADSFDAVERVGVSASHRGLLTDKNVFQLIQNWLGVSPKTKVKHSKTSKVMDANINRSNGPWK